MTKEEKILAEIEYVYNYHRISNNLCRDLKKMEDVIYEVTNSLMPLGDFYNDYLHFHVSGRITKECRDYAINHIYMIALEVKLYLVRGEEHDFK